MLPLRRDVTFHEKRFLAALLFECAGPIADPTYHHTGDVSNRKGFDFGQLRSITEVHFATLLHVAEHTIEPED